MSVICPFKPHPAWIYSRNKKASAQVCTLLMRGRAKIAGSGRWNKPQGGRVTTERGSEMMTITKPFARVVFTIAGIWGILIMTPLYFTFDAVGRAYPPPITHPDLYYGFIGVTLAWQIAFLVIATDPVRYRTIMLAGILEKLLYVTT